MLISLLLIAGGIALLYWGGELLVSNAIALARHFGISAMVVGLTVVAFATSSPELAATATAALRGSSDMALGNIIGSNVANVGLILGLSVLLTPAAASRGVRRELAIMMLASILIYPLLLAGLLVWWHGLLLLAGLAFFLFTLLRSPDVEPPEMVSEDDVERSMVVATLGIALGIAFLVAGAQALITGAVDVARVFGVSERVVGLTVVAFGTSLPELATCLVAARRGQNDIVLGNVIGSNIFNLLFILGVTSLIRPIAVAPEVLRLDYWMMLATSGFIAAFLGIRHRLGRVAGLALVAGYVVYVGYLFF